MEPRVDTNLVIAGEPDAWVHSACILCSNGCGLDIAVKDGAIVGVRGRVDHPVGHLGPKGEHGWVANATKRRGTAPMIRRGKTEKLREVSWPEALTFFVERLNAAWASGHQNLACYNSGQLVLEEFYTLAKLWRGGLQSSNIDGNTRLCTATAATALTATFGTDGPVASYVDIDQAELICLYGHNVAETQTVLWERMLAARERNGGRGETVEFADIYLPAGMAYELLREMGAVRWPCNEKHPRGAERLYEDLKFNTGIDDCEGFGVDFLTGTKTTRSDYARRDPKGKAKLIPVHWRRPPNPVTDEFPLLLNTGRLVYHFHTRTKTARSEALNERAPAAYVEIHPDDAAALGIDLGDVVELSSPHGRTEAIAMVVDTVRPGELAAPFHYGRDNQTANVHTWYARDAVSKQPHFKSSPVSLRRLSFGEPEPWLLARLDDLTGKSATPFAARTFGGTVNVIPATATAGAVSP